MQYGLVVVVVEKEVGKKKRHHLECSLWWIQGGENLRDASRRERWNEIEKDG